MQDESGAETRCLLPAARSPPEAISLLLSLDETSNKFWQRALRVKGQHSLERTETSRMKTKTAEDVDEETMWPSNWVVVTTTDSLVGPASKRQQQSNSSRLSLALASAGSAVVT